MDNIKTYLMRQQYYNGFSFLPIDAVTKHNYFVYKTYTGEENLYPLFDCVLNKEVLDIYYIVTIRKALEGASTSITEKVVNDLEYARDAAALFFKETGEDHLDLVFVERNLRILQRSLENFTEVQQRLITELNNLLTGKNFPDGQKTTSADIDNIREVFLQVSRGIQRCLGRLGDFSTKLPADGQHKQPASMAKYCTRNLVHGLLKWVKVQESIINNLQGWCAVRVQHERQEIMN